MSLFIFTLIALINKFKFVFTRSEIQLSLKTFNLLIHSIITKFTIANRYFFVYIHDHIAFSVQITFASDPGQTLLSLFALTPFNFITCKFKQFQTKWHFVFDMLRFWYVWALFNCVKFVYVIINEILYLFIFYLWFTIGLKVMHLDSKCGLRFYVFSSVVVYLCFAWVF